MALMISDWARAFTSMRPQAPFAANYRMWTYVTEELPALVAANFDAQRHGITGHSMGGHGALTIGLSLARTITSSVSAFAPIVAPSQVPWGHKALAGYLGADRAAWRRHDAVALIEDGARLPDLLVDQGEADQFLTEQLRPELLGASVRRRGHPADACGMQPGYDHSYYFVSTFLADHVRWHAERLG